MKNLFINNHNWPANFLKVKLSEFYNIDPIHDLEDHIEKETKQM